MEIWAEGTGAYVCKSDSHDGKDSGLKEGQVLTLGEISGVAIQRPGHFEGQENG